MSTLEFNGEQNQRNYAQMGNISASNDPLQQGYNETAQIIKNAESIGAGRTLGLDDDTSLKLALRKERMEELREQQRRSAKERREGSDAGSFTQDERIQEIDANEQRFQKEVPQRAADPLELLQLGADEADLQQIRAGKIENILQVDQAGGGEGGRDRRRLQQQIKDRQPLEIEGLFPNAKGRMVRIDKPVNEAAVPDDLREAAMLQELGLAYPERKPARYVKDKKSGKRRRNFGRPLEDAEGNIVSERMTRVRRARETGQLQNPNDLISSDLFTTPRAAGYVGIADDGPEGIRSPMMASQRAGNDAYARLVEAVNSGQVSLDQEVAPGKTVRNLITSMAQEQSGGVARQMMKDESANTAIGDMRMRKENNRRILRQVAVEAAAAGEPLTTAEANTLLKRLETDNAAADSYRVAEREAIGNIGSFGNTNEVIGESIMSDEAWKAKSGKMINPPMVAPEPVIYARNLDISNEPAIPYTDLQGNIVGYRAGAQILGDDVSIPDIDQVIKTPTPQQQNLIDFISQTMDQPDKGGVQDVVITDAMKAFTDQVAKQNPSKFGEQVRNLPEGVRSIAEAQQLVDSLIDTGLANNKDFSRYNPEDPSKPKKVPSGERPTVSDLMSTIRMEPANNTKLANALYQLALAEGQDVNQSRKGAYATRTGSYAPITRPEGFSAQVNLEMQRRGTPAVDLPRTNITFDSPAGFFYDGTMPAYITNSQRARIGEIEADGQAKNVNLQPLLRTLNNPDASEPSIGLLPGETGNYRYRKGFGRDEAGELRDYETGYTELERKRASKKNPYSQRKVDTNIAIAKAVEDRMAADAENRAVRGIMKQAESASFDDRMRAQDAGDYQQSLKNEQFELQKVGAPQRAVTATQPTRPAQVAPSIAPDPWAETGPAVKTQGPRMSEGTRTRQQRIDQMKNFGIKNRKALTYGALGAGASAVLAGILGGGQEDELGTYR